MALRRVGGKQQSRRPFPIVRGWASQERSSVDGEGLKEYASDRRLGVAQCKDGKPADEAVHKAVLPAARLSKDALCLTPTHLERPLMKFTKNKERKEQ
jgi:hypothetical protein